MQAKLLKRAVLFILMILMMGNFSCKPKKSSSQNIQAWNSEDWPIARGNPSLTAFVDVKMPDKISIKWTFKFDDVLLSSPVIAKGILYAAAQSGSIYAFSLETKSLLWKIQIDDSFESSPLYRNGFLYLGSFSGIFFKIDAKDGSILWKKEIGTRIAGSANFLPNDSSTVFFGSYDSRFYALDTKSGKIRHSFAAKNYINGSPAARGGMLAFGSCDGNLYLIKGSAVKTEKVYDFGNYIAGSPVFHDNQVTAAAYNGTVKSYNTLNHKLLWEWEASSEEGFIASPATDGKSIVIGNKDGAFYALDAASGRLNWEFATGGGIEASAVIIGDKVFCGAGDGYFYVLNLSSGKEIASFALNGIPYAGAAWYQGNIYCLTDKGVLYCFGG